MSWCCPLVSRVTPIVCSAYIRTHESYKCHNTYCVKYNMIFKPIFDDKDQLCNLFKQLKNFEVEDMLYLAHITVLIEIFFPKKVLLILSAYSILFITCQQLLLNSESTYLFQPFFVYSFKYL